MKQIDLEKSLDPTVEAHPGAVEVHPGALKVYPTLYINSNPTYI
jgi:hypothetical protein